MSDRTTTDWATGVLNKLTGTGEKLAVVEYKLDTFTDYTKNKLDEVDNRLTKVENKLDEVDNRLTKVENKLEGINKKLDSITERLDNNDGKFAEIEPVMQQLKTLIKLGKWTLGGVGAIAFSIMANYLYAWLH